MAWIMDGCNTKGFTLGNNGLYMYVQIWAPTAQKQEGIQFQILQKPKDFELTMLWTEL